MKTVTMDQNTGGPDIWTIGTNLTMTGSSLSNNNQTLLYADKSNLDVSRTTFKNGGSF